MTEENQEPTLEEVKEHAEPLEAPTYPAKSTPEEVVESKKAEPTFDEAGALIDEVTNVLGCLQKTKRFSFLTEKFAAKFPDRIHDMNEAITSVVHGFAKSLEIKK